ncbi:MAG TPA: helix-turn-helix domain-containing protein [Chloroflexota bacterium]
MAIIPEQFERVAEVVTERTSELLSTEVSVVDERGVVVASSERVLVGDILRPSHDERSSGYLGIPLRHASHEGTVLVAHEGASEEISPRLTRVLVEMVISQTAVVDRLANKHELKNKFIYDLLHGELDDEAAVLREAQILGMDLSPPRLVLLIDAADYILAPYHGAVSESRVRQRAQVIIGSVVEFFELPNDTICAYIGNGEVAVLKASNRKNLERWVAHDEESEGPNPSWANLEALKRASNALLAHLRRVTRADISLSIGRQHPGWGGLPRSYVDARAALSLGRRFHGTNRLHCLDSLGIAAFVGIGDERTKIDLATYLLSPLDHEPDLIATVKVFFAHNCCPTPAAQALSIHRNTLSYRLDKIAALTGLDPRVFDDAVEIQLALVLRSLRNDSAERVPFG